MAPPGSAQFAVVESVTSAAPPGATLQLRVRLLGIGPMIRRRVLVPESVSLLELHGVVQPAMDWEGIHLFEFAAYFLARDTLLRMSARSRYVAGS